MTEVRTGRRPAIARTLAAALLSTVFALAAADAATINFTPVRSSPTGWSSLAIDPVTGQYYERRNYDGSTTTVYVYANAAAFAADTPMGTIFLSPAAFDGTYALVHAGEIYGRASGSGPAGTTATSTWSLTTGAVTSSNPGYAGMGGVNSGSPGGDTFNWGGYSGVNFMQDATGRYVVGGVAADNNWQIEKLGVGLNSISTTIFTPSTLNLGWAFIINGTLFTGATYNTNMVSDSVDVTTGAVTAVSHTLSGLGGSFYLSNFSYDYASDTLYVYNSFGGGWFAASNASVQFGIPLVACLVSGGADTCLIDAATNQATPIDALGGSDTLQLGGPGSFSFNVAAIGTTYTNFETFQKIDASNVTLTGVAGTAVNWDIQGGLLTASTGNNIFNTSTVNVGALGTFAVASSETIGRLTGSGATAVAALQTLTVGDATNFAYTGTTSGLGGLTKVGTGTMSTGNLGHLGLTTVSGGTLNVNGTIADSVVINGGATLSGNATIAGSLTLNAGGTLAPGNSPGTTIVGGAFIGGGTILTEVQFNNAGAPVNGTTHDFLSIGGNVSGTTLLNVVPFAPSNAPVATTGNGIELVRVGGTTTAGAFQLSAPLVFGSIEYTLNYLPNYSGTLDGYFLQSRASASMHGEAALLAAGQAMVAGCLTGEDALIGDGTAHRGRVWAKVGGGNRDSGADTGLDASNNYECATGGIDIGATEQVRIGLSGGFGTSDGNVLTPAGAGRLEGDGGIVQLYAEFHSGNFFANVSGGWGAFDWSFDGPTTNVTSAKLDGTIGALQLGHSWPIDWFRLSAIGQVAYYGMDCGADCFLAGTAADANEWSYKGTLRADTVLSDGELKPYLALSLASGGENTVTNGAVSLTTDTQALHMIAKAGASFKVDTQTALFINGGFTEGLDNDIEGWDIGAGIKAMW